MDSSIFRSRVAILSAATRGMIRALSILFVYIRIRICRLLSMNQKLAIPPVR
jgi:hypothetical protein